MAQPNFFPTDVNAILRDHTSLRLSIEGGWDDAVFDIVSLSYGQKLTPARLASNHVLGAGHSLGTYSNDGLTLSVPSEQWDAFVRAQPPGYATAVRSLVVTWISRSSRASTVVEFFGARIDGDSLSSQADSPALTTTVNISYRYYVQDGVPSMPIDANAAFVTFAQGA